MFGRYTPRDQQRGKQRIVPIGTTLFVEFKSGFGGMGDCSLYTGFTDAVHLSNRSELSVPDRDDPGLDTRRLAAYHSDVGSRSVIFPFGSV